MAVEHQNALPGLDFDVMRATDVVGGPFTPPGFYYKTFIRPRRLWPVYEKVLRHVAGLGKLPKRQDERRGARSTAAATATCWSSAAGSPAWRPRCAPRSSAPTWCCATTTSSRAARCWPRAGTSGRGRSPRGPARRAWRSSRGAPALGFYDGLVPVWQGDTLHQIRAARHVAATGTLEQPLVFPDNDLPGVMLAGGARRLAALYAVKPGETAVVATMGDRGLDAALALHAAGVRVAAVADLRPDAGGGGLAERVRAAGHRAAAGHHGGARARPLGADRRRCSAGRTPPARRPGHAARGRVRPARGVGRRRSRRPRCCCRAAPRRATTRRPARFVAESLHPQVLVAGAVAGFEDADAAELSGRVAGAEAAIALGFGDAAARVGCATTAAASAALPPPAPEATPPAYARDGKRGGKAFVDLDEDQTVKDIAYAAAEGYDSIELSKRYTTVTMGPSQGRFSQLAAIRALGAHTGPDARRGRHDHGAPAVGARADGRAGRAARSSPPSARPSTGASASSGAHVKWAGDWRRAYDYGDPEGEALAVHESAGVIDVSTLGKLLVRGPDAGELLDRLYPNRFSNLAPGRVRYGVMTSDAGPHHGRRHDLPARRGRLLRHDDVERRRRDRGVVRLVAGHVGPRRARHRRHAGARGRQPGRPAARAILPAGLSDLDVSPDAFKYLDARQGAGGRRRRRCSCGSASSARSATRSTSRPPTASTCGTRSVAAGARPFGLEPQRVLRLQKLHVIVGQDTDSESTPYSAAMPWIVKLDKEQDFIGRWALEHAAERQARDRAGRLHDGRRARPHGGRRGPRGRRRAARPGDQLAPLAPARRR